MLFVSIFSALPDGECTGRLQLGGWPGHQQRAHLRAGGRGWLSKGTSVRKRSGAEGLGGEVMQIRDPRLELRASRGVNWCGP